RQDDDGHRVALGAQLLQHREAVEAGQADVEHHEVVLAAARGREGRRAVAFDRDAEARGPQALLDERRDAVLIFRHQDARHQFFLPRGCRVNRGSLMTTRVPVPPLMANASPPWASEIAATIDNPSPDPSTPRPSSARMKRSNTVVSCS